MLSEDEFDVALAIVGLFDAGVPNRERIVLRPQVEVSLATYGLAVAVGAGDAGGFPLYDNVFWFPDVIVEPPAWIYVYTGAGKIQQTRGPNNDPALVFHWQRPTTLFGPEQLVPLLLRIGGAEVVRRIPPRT